MVEKSVLKSGLVVISEYIPAFPSFALSYTVQGGSRIETKKNNGIYHLIEHMMFKGTEKYNLKEIADISDRLGGKLNAFTSKEITQYYIKAVDEHLDQSFDLLTQMVQKSIFLEDEFNKEKSVAIQEIHESEDNPDSNAFETFYSIAFKENGMGFPVGGQVDAVSSFNRDSVYDFYKNQYSPNNMVLSAVGKVTHQQLVELAEKAFQDYPEAKPRAISFKTPKFDLFSEKKNNSSLNQVYMIMGFDSIDVKSPEKFHYMIMNDILGAGMSSRLFQKIREEKGLAYTVSSFSDPYLDCGVHLIYSVVKPAQTEECLEAVKKELVNLRTNGVTENELARARDSIKSSILLGLENNVSKMRFNVNNQLFQGRDVSTDEIIENINKTSKEDILRLADQYLNPNNMSVLLYGSI